jgi:hypothetical protein
MAEAPSQVRDAIAQTRAEVSDTIHALGERVDAARHAAEKLSDETDHLLSAAAHAGSKAADFGQQALGGAANQLKGTTRKQRLLLPILLAAGLAGLLAIFMVRRRRDVADDSPEWDLGEE